ncbi:hypothetical protein M501DRAFT_993662 [Patellaria atrata CBS 101060]|uniref:SET domain-containing protein n=1 Tax=Patellaria atrata CBS 101060 TaxID=1346257 RepID=A0A9P4SJD9_9PEZI|nr:hypothetical protein M501DRAFT_993662 [Patellaria atrata CBS 101060]
MNLQDSEIPPWVQPDLSKLLTVEKSTEAFGSRSTSRVSLPPGALFARITTVTIASDKAWSSVQAGPNLHLDLNSDLLYTNHSCDPSLVFDMKRYEVRVVDNKPLKVGDTLTYFYPSTEWEFAQPFECKCGAGGGKCKVWIAGAKDMKKEHLVDYWLNDHIRKLLATRN